MDFIYMYIIIYNPTNVCNLLLTSEYLSTKHNFITTGTYTVMKQEYSPQPVLQSLAAESSSFAVQEAPVGRQPRMMDMLGKNRKFQGLFIPVFLIKMTMVVNPRFGVIFFGIQLFYSCFGLSHINHLKRSLSHGWTKEIVML